MNNTKIEWCDSTWNPVTGCLHDCEYCYARRIAKRFGGFEPSENGSWNTIQYEKGAERLGVLNERQFRKQENGNLGPAPYPFGFTPTLHRYRLNEYTQKTKPRTIFVCSMSDLFGDWVPDDWLEEVFAACEKAPQHRYLFLTKNVSRYTDYGVPISDNMWYGISVTKESQMSDFNMLPAYCHTFISFEPLLENLDASRHNIMFRQVDWFIIGAETGNQKGKIIPQKEWIDSIAALADKYHKPIFMKDSLLPIVGEENMRREFPW